MSHRTIVNRSQLLAAATAISAVGLLVIPAPAQAKPMLPLAPACSQYSFPNGDWPIQIQDGGQFVISTHHGATAAGRVLSNGKYQGNVTSGGIYNGRNIDFNITFADGVMGRYRGTVGDDALVHGGVGDPTGDIPGARWDSTRPLECNDAPPPAPAQQPAPPDAQTAAPRLGVVANGPTTLATGMSGTYTVSLSNSGDVSAPVELYISYGSPLQQAGQVTPSGGFNCEVLNHAGGSTAVHCTLQQLQSKATANIVVQGRGSAPGAGHLTATISSSAPAAQFVQKSQQLNVSIS
jgi:hypothetical protein